MNNETVPAISLIVIGYLNTDIIASGLKRFPRPGELVYGKQLVVGPGGKPRNIAAMAAALMGKDKVAMIGRTAQDPYGLWKAPLDALQDAGVNTNFIVIDDKSGKMPGIALIPVTDDGINQIMLLPGANEDFSEQDVDNAAALFDAAGKNKGFLALSMECPVEAMMRAIQIAKEKNLQIVFDPGGIDDDFSKKDMLRGLYLIKPNEHETQLLTGVEVTDFESARRASVDLILMGVENVLITAGVNGAYLFCGDTQKHIPVPAVKGSEVRDETGCGDQTMATLCAELQAGKPIEEAAELAVLAGTLQFYKQGIQPVTREELESARV